MNDAGIGVMDLAFRDDARGFTRHERDAETVRDVHVAAERQDPEHDLGADERSGDRLHRAIAAGDDARVVSLGHRALREITRGPLHDIGLDAVEGEAGIAEVRDDGLEVIRSRGAVTGRGIHDQESAQQGRSIATARPERGYSTRTLVFSS